MSADEETILTTDQFRLWTPSVVAYLAGKDMAYGADLAKAVGRSYGTMGVEDWRTLATIMKSLGWRFNAGARMRQKSQRDRRSGIRPATKCLS